MAELSHCMAHNITHLSTPTHPNSDQSNPHSPDLSESHDPQISTNWTRNDNCEFRGILEGRFSDAPEWEYPLIDEEILSYRYHDHASRPPSNSSYSKLISNLSDLISGFNRIPMSTSTFFRYFANCMDVTISDDEIQIQPPVHPFSKRRKIDLNCTIDDGHFSNEDDDGSNIENLQSGFDKVELKKIERSEGSELINSENNHPAPDLQTPDLQTPDLETPDLQTPESNFPYITETSSVNLASSISLTQEVCTELQLGDNGPSHVRYVQPKWRNRRPNNRCPNNRCPNYRCPNNSFTIWRSPLTLRLNHRVARFSQNLFNVLSQNSTRWTVQPVHRRRAPKMLDDDQQTPTMETLEATAYSPTLVDIVFIVRDQLWPFLDLKSLTYLSSSCRDLFEITEDFTVWRQICQQYSNSEELVHPSDQMDGSTESVSSLVRDCLRYPLPQWDTLDSVSSIGTSHSDVGTSIFDASTPGTDDGIVRSTEGTRTTGGMSLGLPKLSSYKLLLLVQISRVIKERICILQERESLYRELHLFRQELIELIHSNRSSQILPYLEELLESRPDRSAELQELLSIRKPAAEAAMLRITRAIQIALRRGVTM